VLLYRRLRYGYTYMSFTIPNWLEHFLAGPVLLYRRLRYGYTYRLIPLTKGKYAIVDPDDYYWLSEYKWYAFRAGNKFYATRKRRGPKGIKRKTIGMHREVANTPENMVCDHINGKPLDNRKTNLRPATRQQNSWNMSKPLKASCSKYKGVAFHKREKKWSAQIIIDGRQISLGTFEDETEAAKEYDKAAKKYFGQFAKLNFKE